MVATATISLRQLARQLALAGDNEDDFAEAVFKGRYSFVLNEHTSPKLLQRLRRAANGNGNSNSSSCGASSPFSLIF